MASNILDRNQEQDEHVNKSFSELGLNSWLVKQCDIVGISKPSPIQMNCIPKILEGSDCIGCAKTGSGKTAAFALPLLQLLSEDPYGIFALIITPTRELAHQIGEHFKVLGKPVGLKYSIIIGGGDMVNQGIELSNKPHIVIATPGRLADHIENGTDFSLKKIRFLVLDEADRLLEDKFGDQLQTIFSALPPKRQTLLFSATLTDTLQQLEHISNNKPFVWVSKDIVATVDTLTQKYVLCPADVKDAFLVHIVDVFKKKHPNSSVMIFVSTCKYCQILAMVLTKLKFECVALHSVLQQKMRLDALHKFKSSQVKILVATDVASRGLDIPTVDLIINHNVPSRTKDYIHRVGRTARAGRGGMALTLVTPFDVRLLHAVEEHIGIELQKHDIDETEVAKIALEVNVLRREAEINLEESDFGEKKEVNKRKHELILQQSSEHKGIKNKKKRKKHSKS